MIIFSTVEITPPYSTDQSIEGIAFLVEVQADQMPEHILVLGKFHRWAARFAPLFLLILAHSYIITYTFIPNWRGNGVNEQRLEKFLKILKIRAEKRTANWISQIFKWTQLTKIMKHTTLFCYPFGSKWWSFWFLPIVTWSPRSASRILEPGGPIPLLRSCRSSLGSRLDWRRIGSGECCRWKFKAFKAKWGLIKSGHRDHKLQYLVWWLSGDIDQMFKIKVFVNGPKTPDSWINIRSVWTHINYYIIIT